MVEKQREAREGRIPLYAAAGCSRILDFSAQECSLHRPFSWHRFYLQSKLRKRGSWMQKIWKRYGKESLNQILSEEMPPKPTSALRGVYFKMLRACKSLQEKAKPTQSSSCWEFTLMPRHCHCLVFLTLPAKGACAACQPFPASNRTTGFWGGSFSCSFSVKRIQEDFAMLQSPAQSPPRSHTDTGHKLLCSHGIYTSKGGCKDCKPPKIEVEMEKGSFPLADCKAKGYNLGA